VKETAPPSPLGPRLNIARMLRESPPPMDDVLPGLMAGTVGMVAGAGGVGKTMFELQLAVWLASGLSWASGPLGHLPDTRLDTRPCRVVLALAEEPAEVIWSRIHNIVGAVQRRALLPDDMEWTEFGQRLSANLEVYALAGARRLTLMDEALGPTEDFQAVVTACQGARLVILDPLRQLHLSRENESADMSAMVSLFKQLAQRSGAAVLFAHHLNRAAGQMGFAESADAARGSTSLVADVRWQVNLSEPTKERLKALGAEGGRPEDFMVVSSAKANYLRRASACLLERDACGVLMPHVAALRSSSAKRRRSA
jgi:RecA-family ATPase